MTDPAVKAALQRTAEILAKPEAWTKYANARNALGDISYPTSDRAVCFCLLGARRRAVSRDQQLIKDVTTHLALSIHELFPARAPVRYDNGVVSGFNDDPLTTHADVLKVVHHAIG